MCIMSGYTALQRASLRLLGFTHTAQCRSWNGHQLANFAQSSCWSADLGLLCNVDKPVQASSAIKCSALIRDPRQVLFNSLALLSLLCWTNLKLATGHRMSCGLHRVGTCLLRAPLSLKPAAMKTVIPMRARSQGGWSWLMWCKARCKASCWQSPG